MSEMIIFRVVYEEFSMVYFCISVKEVNNGAFFHARTLLSLG